MNNVTPKELGLAFLRSLAGMSVGYLLYLIVSQMIFYGIGTGLAVLMPTVLISVIFGFVFSIWNLMFALFFTMFVLNRRGLTAQEVWYWVGGTLVFSALFGMIGGGFSILGLVMMGAQIAATSFGAHYAHRIKF